MKLVIATYALLCVAACAPSLEREIAARRALPAVLFEELRDEFGQFALRYVTGEGAVVSERGRLVPAEAEGEYVLVTEGEISFVGDDGELYVTKFTADLDGVHVEGSHLPVAPESIVPQELQAPIVSVN